MQIKAPAQMKDERQPSIAPCSILHEEIHPSLTYSLVAIGAFFAGMVILGAISVKAGTNSSPAALSQLNEIKIDIGALNQRLDAIEDRLEEQTISEKELVTDCEALERALPLTDAIRRVPSSIACYEAPGIGMPNQKFLSVTALYQYLRAENETREITVQIFDFGNERKAVNDFLTMGAYLPVDDDRVKREDTFVNDYIGVFTYEGLPSDGTEYERGANWFVIDNRFGILVHGTPVGFTDRTKLDEVTGAVDMEALANIR